ncbi:helix-turn-helix domain-containing protein [Bryobacter aggregatus]|uniref:helix-turn-helix domain-containing protein n=1 Tax=Bryobacter aggregatus TaxID=360054 RepID=UPI0004E1A8BE|nr:helix-turn-helix domain-containing protein [Bryobacter aggregatus]
MTDGLHATETYVLETLQKISSSPPIAGAESLRNLLSYLVRQSTEHPGEPIREAAIAAAVFNKAENFDPRQDSTVRVQTSRLRAKLVEYYQGEGANDAWILEIPKGSYAISLKARELPEPEPLPVLPPQPLSPWLYALGGFVAGVWITWLALTKMS